SGHPGRPIAHPHRARIDLARICFNAMNLLLVSGTPPGHWIKTMMSIRRTPRIAPPMRPLTFSLLLALGALPLGELMARPLDGEAVEIDESHAVEAWSLINGATLRVNGGSTYALTARDTSSIDVQDAWIRANPDDQLNGTAVRMMGTSTLLARDTRFEGTVAIADAATALIQRSTLVATAPGAAALLLVTETDDIPHAVLDASHLVSPYLANPSGSAGVGARIFTGGSLTLVNGSTITADSVAIQVLGRGGSARVTIDGSRLQSEHSAGIWIATFDDQSRHHEITVANDSRIQAGDGNLLLVSSYSGTATNDASAVTFTIDDARLTGNVTVDRNTANTAVEVMMRNNARIDGRFRNVGAATLGTGSIWTLTGDSNVGRLQLDASGTVALGNGSTFNTLTVDTFVGNGGTLLLNTALGDDGSATDRLVITGDAEGEAGVRVRNAGGAGAKTDLGIELINIGGASNARFDLIGRAVGGQYEYFLVKGTNGHWYLRSEVLATPAPCDVDPSLPECQPIDPVDPVDPEDPIHPVDPTGPTHPTDPADPVPVLRPEAGAYLANQFALTQLLRHSWRDRNGDDAVGNDGVHAWARVDSTQSRLGAVEDQLALRVDRSRLQIGADIGVFDADRGRVGVMFTAAQSQATSRSVLTGYSARGKVDGGAAGVYGNWSNDALYVDASVQRGQFRNRVEGDGLDTERYDADLWQSSLEAGYQIDIGHIGAMALRLQPELQLVYTDASTDQHRETNGTVARSLGEDGLSGRLGLRIEGESKAGSGAAVRPYVAANWYRDGASTGIAFDDEALHASTPRDRYALSGGARVAFGSGVSGWGGLRVMRGDGGYREASAQVGMSFTW
ncbi:MAG: autotransporter outer membrane beta-barrel domain-containing protein, partial [Stenotrophomonas sp.]